MELDGGDVKQLLSILQQLVEKVTVASTGTQQDIDSIETTKTPKRKKKTVKKQQNVVAEEDEDSQDEQEFSSKIKSKKISVKQ